MYSARWFCSVWRPARRLVTSTPFDDGKPQDTLAVTRGQRENLKKRKPRLVCKKLITLRRPDFFYYRAVREAGKSWTRRCSHDRKSALARSLSAGARPDLPAALDPHHASDGPIPESGLLEKDLHG